MPEKNHPSFFESRTDTNATDNYSAITFAVLAILFAAIALITFGKPPSFSLVDPAVVLGLCALIVSALAFYYAKSESEFVRNMKNAPFRRLSKTVVAALLIGAAMWTLHREVFLQWTSEFSTSRRVSTLSNIPQNETSIWFLGPRAKGQ